MVFVGFGENVAFPTNVSYMSAQLKMRLLKD
jgi:hypothetical protein